MGLFKKKYTERKVTCVHCGRTHVLRKYFAKEYYLDGMPKLSTEKLLAQYTVCECGAFIYQTAEYNPVSKELMDSQQYKDALSLPIELQEFTLLNLAFPHAISAQLYLLHYNYTKSQLQHCLECATRPNAAMISFPSAAIPALNAPKGIFAYSAALCEIDLLRQAGDWDTCMHKIQQQRNREFPPMSPKRERFLAIEEELVAQHNHSLQ